MDVSKGDDLKRVALESKEDKLGSSTTDGEGRRRRKKTGRHKKRVTREKKENEDHSKGADGFVMELVHTTSEKGKEKKKEREQKTRDFEETKPEVESERTGAKTTGKTKNMNKSKSKGKIKEEKEKKGTKKEQIEMENEKEKKEGSEEDKEGKNDADREGRKEEEEEGEGEGEGERIVKKSVRLLMEAKEKFFREKDTMMQTCFVGKKRQQRSVAANFRLSLEDDDVQAEFQESSQLRMALFSLIRAGDEKTLRDALRACAIVATLGDKFRIEMSGLDVVERCISYLGHKDKNVRAAAAILAANVGMTPDVLVNMFDHFDLSSLAVSFLSDATAEVSVCGTRIMHLFGLLENEALRTKCVHSLIRRGARDSLIDAFLHTKSHEVLEGVCRAMATLMDDVEVARQFVRSSEKEEFFLRLFEVTEEAVGTVVYEAARCVAKICHIPEMKNKMFREFPPILVNMAQFSGTLVRIEALNALAFLTENDDNRCHEDILAQEEEEIHHRAELNVVLTAVIDALLSTEEFEIFKECRDSQSVAKFYDYIGYTSFIAPIDLDTIRSRVREKYYTMPKTFFDDVHLIVQTVENIDFEGGFDPYGMKDRADALQYMAKRHEEQIVREHARMVEVMSRFRERVNLRKNLERHRVEIMNMGGLSFFPLLLYTDDNLLFDTARCLANIAIPLQNQEKVVEDGDMEPIVKCMTHASDKVRTELCRLLSNFCMHDGAKRALAGRGIVTLLAHLFKQTTTVPLRVGIMKTFYVMSDDEKLRGEIISSGILDEVLNSCYFERGPLQLEAIKALASLVHTSSVRDYIITHAALPAILHVARSEEYMLQSHAVRLLSTFCESGVTERKHMLKYHALDVVTEIARFSIGRTPLHGFDCPICIKPFEPSRSALKCIHIFSSEPEGPNKEVYRKSLHDLQVDSVAVQLGTTSNDPWTQQLALAILSNTAVDDETKSFLLESSSLPLIAQLCDASHLTSRMRNLGHEDHHHRSHHGSKQRQQEVDEEALMVQVQAYSVLASFGSSGIGPQALTTIEEIWIIALHTMQNSHFPHLLSECARLLSCGANIEEQALSMTQIGILPAIKESMGRKGPQYVAVRTHAARVIKNMAAFSSLRPSIVESGFIDAFLDLTSFKNVFHDREVASFFAHLADDHQYRDGLVDGRTLGCIIAYIRDTTDHIVLEMSAYTISNLAETLENRSIIGEEGAIRHLNDVFGGNKKGTFVSLSSRLHAGNALFRVIERNHMNQFRALNAGCLEGAIQGTKHEDERFRKIAFKIVSSLAENEVIKEKMLHDPSNFALIIAMSHGESISTQRHASGIFLRLAQNEAHIDAMLMPDMLETLCFVSGREDIIQIGNALKALRTLSSSSKGSRSIANVRGSLESLIKHFDSSHVAFRRDAIDIVGRIAFHCDAEVSLSIVKQNKKVIRNLLVSMKTINPGLKASASHTLCELAQKQPHLQKKIVSHKLFAVIPRTLHLIDKLLRITSQRAMTVDWETCRLLGILSRHPDVRFKMASNQSLMNCTIRLLRNQNTSIAIECMKFVANLFDCAENRLNLSQNEVFSHVLRQTRSSVVSLRVEAIRALANACRSPDIATKLQKDGEMMPFLNEVLVPAKDYAILAHAARMMANLACTSSAKEEAYQTGGIRFVIELAKTKDADTVEQCVRFLSNMAVNQTYRRQIEKDGGIPFLLDSLVDSSRAVQSQSIRGISLLTDGKIKDIAGQFIRKGLISAFLTLFEDEKSGVDVGYPIQFKCDATRTIGNLLATHYTECIPLVPFLCQCCHSEDMLLQFWACRALKQIDRKLTMEIGTWKMFAALSRSTFPEILSFVAGFLEEFASTSRIEQISFHKSFGTETLLLHLTCPSDEELIPSLMALKQISDNDYVSSVFPKFDVMPSLINVIDRGINVRVLVLQLVGDASVNRLCEQSIVDTGVVPLVCNYLRHGKNGMFDEATRTQSARILSNLAHRDDVQRALLHLEGTNLLLQNVSEGNHGSDLLRFCTSCMAYLAFNPSFRDEIGKLGFDILRKVANSQETDMEIRAFICSILANLAENRDFKTSLNDRVFVQCIHTVARNGSRVEKRQAIRSIANLGATLDMHSLVREFEFVDLLCALLKQLVEEGVDQEFISETARALTNICTRKALIDELVALGAHNSLFLLIEVEEAEPDTILQCSVLLSEITRYHGEIILENESRIRAFLEVFRASPCQTRAAILESFSSIAKDPARAANVGTELKPFMPALLRSVKQCRDFSLFERSFCDFLTSMGNSKEGKMFTEHPRIVKKLIQLSNAPDISTRNASVVALCALRHSLAIESDIYDVCFRMLQSPCRVIHLSVLRLCRTLAKRSKTGDDTSSQVQLSHWIVQSAMHQDSGLRHVSLRTIAYLTEKHPIISSAIGKRSTLRTLVSMYQSGWKARKVAAERTTSMPTAKNDAMMDEEERDKTVVGDILRNLAKMPGIDVLLVEIGGSQLLLLLGIKISSLLSSSSPSRGDEQHLKKGFRDMAKFVVLQRRMSFTGAGDVFTPSCCLSGEAMAGGTVGRTMKLFIQTRDKFENDLHSASKVDFFWTLMHLDSLDRWDDTFSHIGGTGMLGAEIKPMHPGDYRVDVVDANGTHVAGSPFRFSVSPGDPDLSLSKVSVPTQLEAGKEEEVEVVLLDSGRNVLFHSEYNVEWEIVGTSVEFFESYRARGKYTFRIMGTRTGVCRCQMSVDHVKMDQSFEIVVHPSKLSPSNCVFICETPPSCVAGWSWKAKIVSKDRFGNHLQCGGHDFRSVLMDISRADFEEVSVIDFGDGTYGADISPTKGGTKSIQCRVRGVEISGSGVSLIVHASAASVDHFTAFGYGKERARMAHVNVFTVQARDCFGNPVPRSDVPLKCMVRHAASGSVVGIGIVKHAVGSPQYRIEYEVSEMSPHLVEVHHAISSKQIKGSPFLIKGIF